MLYIAQRPGDVQQAKAVGLSWLVQQAPKPVIGALEEEALHCWRFCGGYHPAHWPLYVGLHPVPDPMALIDLQGVIREAIRQRDAARAEEEHARGRR
jgi:hypothetical protein